MTKAKQIEQIDWLKDIQASIENHANDNDYPTERYVKRMKAITWAIRELSNRGSKTQIAELIYDYTQCKDDVATLCAERIVNEEWRK